MNIHEFQARDLLRGFGLPVPEQVVARTSEEAAAAAGHFGGRVVVKAQVHAGGRGKAGGVKLAANPEEARAHAARILDMTIKGLRVRQVLVAAAIEIQKEAYVGITLDRRAECPVLMLSAEGGVEIEEVARVSPEKILRAHLDPVRGLQPFQTRRLGLRVFPEPKQGLGLAQICTKLAQAYAALDASLVEINPLVVTGDGQLVAADAKIVLDDNGL